MSMREYVLYSLVLIQVLMIDADLTLDKIKKTYRKVLINLSIYNAFHMAVYINSAVIISCTSRQESR